ncbi:MFS transporter [Adlercreutzia sp. R21]|uniref:MFS transporter n=1 Tax=Adlercreutzia wanghongyangiae TaxID=3111451 RepID=UPI002DBCA1E3|nr:MFS transporter [Adlercreutzia sp. R21]MEC4184441.1 MFS transporter [Adlercreutzia sp. R21]
MAADTTATPASAARKPAAILAVAAFAAFLATFNETFLNVGFAPIMADLGVDVSAVQWLATAYMLGAAVMVPVSAFAYRSFPTRPLFCATAALLVIGSVIGGVATNFAVLLVGRIVQALGTGMLIPIGMNITLEIAPREKLGTYMGIMGAMTTLGPSSSVILAGLILAVANWSMLLWVFAGLSALCLLAGAVILRDIAHLTHPRLDAASVALIGIALIGILYGVSTVFSGSAPVACVAAVVGVVALMLFVRRQGTLAEPLIDLCPLAIPPFTVGVIVNMLSLLTIFAMNIIVPTFMQSVLGTEPLVASLTLFPAILCSCVVSPLAGRIYDKQGPGIILPAGFLCIAVFSVLTGAFIATASPVVLAVIYIPVICGSALVIGPVQSFALSKLPFELNPHGVTIMSTGFQIAGCIGSSVFTGVYAAVSAGALGSGAPFGDACAQAMLVTGILVGAVGLVGLALALWVRGQASKPSIKVAGSAAAATDELAAEPTVSAIMKTEVYTLPETALVAEALELFTAKGISGAPVVDGAGRVTGFISDGDVMTAVADQVPSFKSAWSFIVERENADFDRTLRETMAAPVSSIATKNVICVNVNDDMGKVARVLSEHHLKKAPVLDGDVMVGVINRSNITGYAVRRYLSEQRT